MLTFCEDPRDMDRVSLDPHCVPDSNRGGAARPRGHGEHLVRARPLLEHWPDTGGASGAGVGGVLGGVRVRGAPQSLV